MEWEVQAESAQFGGQVEVAVPRNRNGEFEPKLLKRYDSHTNELEDKVLAMYAKGLSTRDISATLQDLYGVEVSATTISAITEKIMLLVEAWQRGTSGTRWKRSTPSCFLVQRIIQSPLHEMYGA